jgi:hypothetical protein
MGAQEAATIAKESPGIAAAWCYPSKMSRAIMHEQWEPLWNLQEIAIAETWLKAFVSL